MTAPSNSTDPAASQAELIVADSRASARLTSTPIALLIWLLIQLGALLIGAARVELWANYPRPAENLALDLMLVTQAAASALLLPLLLITWHRAALVIATVVPFAHFAAMLTAVPTVRAAAASAYV